MPERKNNVNLRSFASFGADFHRTAQRSRTFPHSREPISSFLSGTGRKPNSVILDRKRYFVGVGRKPHCEIAGARMLSQIVQRFLNRPVQRDLKIVIQEAGVIRQFKVRFDSRVLNQKLCLAANGSHESEFFEDTRRKPGDGAPQTLDGAVEHFERFANLIFLLVGLRVAPQHLEMEPQNHERLAGFIVQFPADTPPLFLLRLQ